MVGYRVLCRCMGVFVLPSYCVLISDMNSGFYFFEPIDLPPYTSVTPNVTGIDACVGTALSFLLRWAPTFLSSGVTLSTEGSSGTIEVQLGATSANPGEIVSVSVTA